MSKGKHILFWAIASVALIQSLSYGQGKNPKVVALVQQLQSAKTADKVAAAIALADFGPDAAPAVPALVAELQARDEYLRLNAAIALGKIGAPAVESVAKLLQSKAPSDRYYAIWTLGWIGPSAKAATPLVIRALADEDNGVRRKAAYALGRIAPDAARAIPPLVKAFADQNEDVRKAAAEALAKFGSASVPALIDALQNDSITLRIEAVRALGSIGSDAKTAVPQLSALFLTGDGKTSAEAAAALSKIGKPAIPALAAALKNANANVRAQAVQALGKIGGDAVPVLVDALADKHVDVRQNAASALSPLRITDKMVVLALAHAAHDPDARVRQQCLRALQLLGAGAKLAAPKLIETLPLVPGQERLQILYVLQNIGDQDKHLLSAAADLLKDASPMLRQSALTLLGSQGRAALPHLIAALSDSEVSVRFAAVNALQRVPGDIKEALPALLPMLKQGSLFQRRAVILALGRVGEPGVPHLLGLLKEKEGATRSYAIDGLRAAGPTAKKAAPALIEIALSDNYVTARRNAVLAVAAVDPNALDELFAKVKKHPNESIRQNAYSALFSRVSKKGSIAALPVKTALPHLIDATKDASANIRLIALQGLANLGPAAQDAVPAVTALAKDADPRVRNQAAVTLTRIKGT